MRTSSLVTAALAATFVSGVAFAATTDTGAIKTLDPAKHQVTLADGKVFAVPTTWKFSDYKVGEKVKVTYEMKNGQMMASAITRTS